MWIWTNKFWYVQVKPSSHGIWFWVSLSRENPCCCTAATLSSGGGEERGKGVGVVRLSFLLLPKSEQPHFICEFYNFSGHFQVSDYPPSSFGHLIFLIVIMQGGIYNHLPGLWQRHKRHLMATGDALTCHCHYHLHLHVSVYLRSKNADYITIKPPVHVLCI